MTETFIPYCRPSIDHSEIEAVVSTLESGWLTTGPRTAQFEAEFKEYVRARHALGVNSCTAGLHLALVALGIGPGDEVITTPLTFCATVNCILHVGATPVLADIGPDGNLDPESVRRRVTERTRALLPVHYGGLPCEMDALWQLAREHRLCVIEDAAHAVGAHYKGRPIGAADPVSGRQSDAVAFSFYANKNLSTGEGGMVTCQRETLNEQMRILCLHGISKDAWNRYTESGTWYYEVVDCGFKYNLSDIQSAIGIQQLHKQEEFLRLRRACAAFYNQHFADIAEVQTPADRPDCRHAWHLYVLRLNLERLTITRSEFIENLRTRGIGASVHFIPIPNHPYFTRYPQLAPSYCPNAIEMYPRLVSLPIYPGLTMEQLEYIVASVKGIIHERERTKIFAAAH